MFSGQDIIVERYARIAPRYDRLHGRWLRYAGGQAQCAFEGAVTALIRPGMKVLDVGCGTGALARRLSDQFGTEIDLTLLDACPQMLRRTADLPARRIVGRLENLPLSTGSFDIVTCAWAIETTPNTKRAIEELLRVTRPGGIVCLAFCADMKRAGIAGRIMKTTMSWRGTGRFLDPESVRAAIAGQQPATIRRLPCHGPAAVIVAEKQAG